MAGGRYDKLAQLLGHKDPIPSIGWAAGVERLAILDQEEPFYHRPISLIPIGPEAEAMAPVIAREIRLMRGKVILSCKGNLKSRMKYANRIKAKEAFIFGETEIKNNKLVVKNLDTGNQKEIELDAVGDYVKFGD